MLDSTNFRMHHGGMNSALAAHEIAALRWFAAATFPEANDRAPELAVCRSLQDRGLLRPSLGSWEPTDAGEQAIAADGRIPSEGDAVAVEYAPTSNAVRVHGDHHLRNLKLVCVDLGGNGLANVQVPGPHGRTMRDVQLSDLRWGRADGPSRHERFEGWVLSWEAQKTSELRFA